MLHQSTSGLVLSARGLANRSLFTATPPRRLATVASKTIVAPPPSTYPSFELDRYLLSTLSQNASEDGHKCLRHVIQDYLSNAGRVLDASLKYESRPAQGRKLTFGSTKQHYGTVMVAHCIKHHDRSQVVTCSGFVIDVNGGGLVVTCAHTLEQVCPYSPTIAKSRIECANSKIRRSPLLELEDQTDVISGSFIVTSSAKSHISVHPVTAIPSCIPRSDVLLLKPSPSSYLFQPLPVSPYPLHAGQSIRAHLVSETPANTDWEPWIGGTSHSWTKGTIKGYRDFAGREAEVNFPHT